MKRVTAITAAVIGLTLAALGTASAAGTHGTGAANSNSISNTVVNGTTATTNGLGFGQGTTGATITTTTGNTGTANTTGTGFGNTGLATGTAQVASRTFDQQFLRKATIDSQQEILLGSVAETNSQDASIQAFGQQLVTDHTAAIAEAQSVAAGLGITLPDTTGNLGVPPRLLTLTGTEFDRQFIAFMIQSHLQDINLFEMAALRGRSADVRAFARDQLPVLMNHLVTALQIREALAGNTTTGTTTGTGTGTSTGTTTNNGTDP